MAIWTLFVEFLQSVLFTATQVCGGNLAVGIIVAGLALRVALFPLTYRMARESRRRALLMSKLQPEIVRLRKRHKDGPGALMTAQTALFNRHGLKLFDGRSLLGGLVQTPFALGMYTVVRRALSVANPGRFLWIPNIGRPDVLLAVGVSLLTYAAVSLGAHVGPHASRALLVIPALITLLALFKFSAGLGLYWGASSAVGVVQGIMLRRAR
jgi:YidC/Oxa1 family membrane protein insertase